MEIPPIPEVNLSVLSVASTIMAELGFGTPEDAPDEKDWNLEDNTSQVRLMCDMVTDVLIAIEKLEANYGPTLKSDLFTYASSLLPAKEPVEVSS